MRSVCIARLVHQCSGVCCVVGNRPLSSLNIDGGCRSVIAENSTTHGIKFVGHVHRAVVANVGCVQAVVKIKNRREA